MRYILHIADKPYSSWSMRGWLLLHAFGFDFEERLHRLYDPEFDAFRAQMAPARSVPALEWTDGAERAILWDSLAIAETLAEARPEAGLWPEGATARAAARSLAAQMHSGFAALRQAAPMNTRRKGPPLAASEAVRADLDRLSELWRWARAGWGAGGPYLFGARFTAADAFFAPVAWRVRGYGLEVDAGSAAYLDALLAHPSCRRWEADAAADPRVIARYEN
ncbi:MAG: glutathione S-transferase [Rubrimonas sp.]|uniref:glutathione S-transferase n=1 Tax=Rubrimonas sp. TaxID=2036015 RepID=UPI002FDD5E50